MTIKLHASVCDDTKDSKDTIGAIKSKIPKENKLSNLAEIFKVFGDPTRLKIIFALRQGELCVMHLSDIIDMEQSAVSHHLRMLRNKKLVKTRREGKNIYYSLDDDHVSDILDIGYEHVTEE